MAHSAVLAKGIEAHISDDGSELIVQRGGLELFRLQAPEHGGFGHFERHAIYGMCPIISFAPEHLINGWMDWYYQVDIRGQTMKRIGPWK